ncbi:MAG: site-specific integrase, partial [Planctomycetales bacterium]|nr:site-specific integrase [Planctomycetales bacterium]
KKFASAHDIRRGFAERLINQGVSAETLKVVMRHSDFATTEKHYGALRSAQSAAAEISKKAVDLRPFLRICGRINGGDMKKLLN